MNLTIDKRFVRQYLIGPLFALVTVLFTYLLFDTSLVYTVTKTSVFPALERRGFDVLMRVRGTRESAKDVVLIKVDDYTDKQLGWPIRRDHYGAVMALLSNSGAKAVALDMLLPKKTSGEDSTENALMVEYLGTTQNTYQVIGPFIPSLTEKEKVSRRDVDSTAHYIIGRFGIPAPRTHHFFRSPFINDYPFSELAAVSAGVGHALLIPDSLDGVIRTVPLFIEYAGKMYPSLGLALAMHTLGISPDQVRFQSDEDGTVVTAGPLTMRTGKWGEIYINYIGAGDMLPAVSFYDVLQAARDRNEKFFAQFKNKVCIIGPTIRSVGDYYATPMDESAPGYTTHANVYDMIVTQNFISRAPGWLHYSLLLLVTFAIGFMSHAKRVRTGVFILFGVMVLYVLFAYTAFAAGNIWFPVVQTLFSMIVCFISTVAYRAATEGRQRKLITEIFGRYVDSAVVNILINNPKLVKLGGAD